MKQNYIIILKKKNAYISQTVLTKLFLKFASFYFIAEKKKCVFVIIVKKKKRNTIVNQTQREKAVISHF